MHQRRHKRRYDGACDVFEPIKQIRRMRFDKMKEHEAERDTDGNADDPARCPCDDSIDKVSGEEDAEDDQSDR